MRILVVEDDTILLDGLTVGLGLAGFTVDAVSNCCDAEAALAAQNYNAVVLDLMLPDGSGLDILKSMRRGRDETPVLLLTARDQVPERIAGLDAGADDYVGKPFDLHELAARVRAVARRGAGRANALLEWRGVELDPAEMSVRFHGEPVRLTRREFSILRALMERPAATFSKSSLEEALYGWQEEVESNAVEVHIHHLRSKLGSDYIETVRGVGYRLAGART
ncbi:DNA-binding response regulator [Ochrobactrum sp. 695/2009]|uniref:response regulator n=1 Tax=Brucella intermedia TaxID=94625 RepID=UPI000C2881D5|nr:response regulator [Brucella intermedia]PJR90376.1 DNA-binding response regulator [Ochrobactrum sp. 721/2009]PJT16337.1 DNA-binding response regulator [Ochrobactrum sp. 720/2009]PJT26157.1 DNA-binding response regulator [Ochrobactrum sp. 715/2009]PJT29764.1 DNA-binding response regulator [Ochrobactrum sp. 695/2009]PJT35676.1 DNA-binding response regulator [Ochrobactrum sp. 689/2009]